MDHWWHGWRFWPQRRPGPVDDEFRQVRWVRPYRPGAPRLAAATALGLLVAYLGSGAVMVTLSPGLPLTTRVMGLLVVGPVCVGLGVLVARGVAAGVYVNDAGLRIVTVRRTLTVPWRAVVDVSDTAGRTGFLGLPLPAVGGRVVVVTLRDLGPVATPVTSVGADFVGRPEAYDMAAGAVERWWHDAGR